LPARYIDRFGRAGKRCRDCRRGGGNLDGAGRSRLLQDALAPHEIKPRLVYLAVGSLLI